MTPHYLAHYNGIKRTDERYELNVAGTHVLGPVGSRDKIGVTAFLHRHEALAAVRTLRAKRIDALRRQIARLEALP